MFDCLQKYKGKKVAVMFSAGLDSSFMAHHLMHTIGAAEVALIMFDCDRENDTASAFYDPTREIDYIKDIWQYSRYAKILSDNRKVTKDYHRWIMRAPELRSLSVNKNNLKEATQGITKFEESRSLTFYSGFVMNHLNLALAVASKYGFDHVLTGHMGWNVHYEDEGPDFAKDMNELFAKYYGPRLNVVPTVEMPYREGNIKKEDLIRDNAKSDFPLDPVNTISCNVSSLIYRNGDAVNFKLKNGYQIHCGKCLHCEDRKRAFAVNGLEDTAYYAE